MPPSTEDEAIAEAEKIKAEANKCFSAHRFPAALDLYSQCIALNAASPVYFCNRAFTNVKLENYGSAIEDASKALELDKSFVKAYYRRGTAYMALGKLKDALRDFQTVAKLVPNDADAQAKLKECKKQYDAMLFAKAIATDDLKKKTSATVVLDDIEVEAAYTGPRLPSDGAVSAEFIKELLSELKAQKKLHRRYVVQMLLSIIELFGGLPTVVDVSIPSVANHITVCGDVHGQFYDLCNIFEMNGMPSKQNPYVFNGDFVDRGSFSVEVIVTLFALKLCDPESIHLTRGNHESRNMNKMYGFEGEVRAKYPGDMVFDLFLEAFCLLPLALVIEGKIFIVHGGLFSKDGVTLDDLRKIDRNREPPDDGLMCEMLWSDPQKPPGRGISKRGVGVQFGPDVTRDFLRTNKLELVVRSHEMKEEGYEVEHNGQLITIFSAPNYCDQMGNKGAFIRFERDNISTPKFTQFAAVAHPAVRPMSYANSMMSFLG